GFEAYKKFVIINDISLGTDIMWLQSLEDKNICFVVFNPFAIFEDYNPTITKEQLEKVEAQSEQSLSYAVIAVISQDIKKTTVNLKSPVIINHKNKKAIQVILDDDYPIKYRIYKGE
ncbi:MAG: flagellar assembly protein FliW, partial [Oscillospiraceae bacterium]